MEPYISLELSQHTRLAISLTLLLMEPFIRECHTNSIMDAQEESSTSIQDPLEWLWINKSETELCRRRFMLESNIWDFQDVEKPSWIESKKMTNSRPKLIKKDKEFQLKELWKPQEDKLTLKSLKLNF